MGEIRDYKYIKNKNKGTVFQLILKKAPVSRAELSRITKMSPTTITRIAKELMDMGYIYETDDKSATNKVGRKAIMLDIVKEAVMTIGVFVDKHVQRIGIIGLNNELIVYEKFQLATDNPEVYVGKLCEKIDSMIIASGVNRENIIGVGMGIPGIVNPEEGIVNLSATLGWNTVGLRKMIEERLKLDTVIDNELKTLSLAEYRFGSLNKADRTVIISFGSGVGSALIVNNEIYRGTTNSAGEIGHTIVDMDGKKCECGKRGCLQTYLMEEELIKQAREHEEVETVGEIFTYYKNGSVWAEEIVEQTIQYIQVTVAHIVAVYNPDVIILDGSLIKNLRESGIDVTQDVENDYLFEPLKGTFQTTYSSLGNKGVVIGAGILANYDFFELE